MSANFHIAGICIYEIGVIVPLLCIIYYVKTLLASSDFPWILHWFPYDVSPNCLASNSAFCALALGKKPLLGKWFLPRASYYQVLVHEYK